ncbi:MAG: SGNH/GDSL hydrolase family protein [Myxacorys californica WJT36-NPBG1]|jgi:phospholipase/lecithinase/hemolysin|nr:SGNH/GDSL hydrolase family protein [Myxacorys californica WJT36-NPBG1]
MTNQITLDFDFPKVSGSLTSSNFKVSRTFSFQIPDPTPLINSVENFLNGLPNSGSISWDIDLGNLDLDCTPSHSSPISGLVIFGDSLSDPGNLFNLTSQQVPPSPPYFDGRFSNGPIWADYLAPRLNLEEASVSNFAFAGAKTGRDNIANALFGLPESLNLPGLLDEVDTFAATTGAKGADPNALYVVWAGSNDLLNLPSDPQGSATGISEAVTNISSAIATLAQLGAEKIVVPNSVNLGLAPFPNQTGVAAQATQAGIAFNQALDQALTTLEPSLGVDIIEVDLFSISQQIAAAPGEFGFTNITDPLFQQSNPTNPEGYFWWDRIHPTTQVHKLVADAFETAIAQSIPVSNGRTTQVSLTDSLVGRGGSANQALVVSTSINRFAESPLNG